MFTPLNYLLAYDDGSMDTTDYKASEVIKDLYTLLKNEYTKGYI